MMHKKIPRQHLLFVRKTFLPLCMLFMTSPLSANDTIDNSAIFDPVIVTARGYAASQSDTPGSVAVVTEEDIATAHRKGSIVDTLEKIPGIARTGDSPFAQDISIRGLSGTSVVVLINGKRINTATDLNFRLGMINPADVLHIEVLKGPVSALYGSGSIGGVVNVITRKPVFSSETKVHGKLFASASTNPGGGEAFGSTSLSGAHAGALISASLRDYGNTYGSNSTGIFNSQFKDKQGRAVLNIKPSDNLKMSLEAIQSIGTNIGIPGGLSTMPPLARVSYPRTRFSMISLDVTADVNANHLKMLEGSFYYTQNKRHVLIDQIPPAITPAYPVELQPSSNHSTWGGKMQANFESGAHTLVVGMDFWTWTISTNRYRLMYSTKPTPGYVSFYDPSMPDTRQTSIGFFAEDNYKINDTLTLNFGARLDYLNTDSKTMYLVTFDSLTGTTSMKKQYDSMNKNDFGYHLHAGLTSQMSNEWSQSVLLASSYRAADVMERFKYINQGNLGEIYGNPDLKPEQTLYAEYGLRYSPKNFHAGMKIFGNIIKNYIAEKRTSPNRIDLHNVADANIYGIELDSRWQFHKNWALYGDVTALYGRDKENHQALPNVAPVLSKLGVDYRKNGFFANLNSQWIAPKHDTPQNVASTSGAIILNTTLGYRFKTAKVKHNIILAINNIFDKRYYNYLANQRGYDLMEPGISASLGYSVNF